MQTFSDEDFLVMPWKNGGGTTKELFRIPNENDGFFFRLSIADVNSSGPFSTFPNIDRILLLLAGPGFHLKSPTLNMELTDTKSPLFFSGEEPIICTLISENCQDFNVMTERDYAKSTISVVEVLKNEVLALTPQCDFKFIYDKEDKKLYKLDKGESLSLRFEKASALIIVDVTLL